VDFFKDCQKRLFSFSIPFTTFADITDKFCFMFLTIVGALKMVLMLIGGFIVLRFVGQLMSAKRNMEHERQLNEESRRFEKEKAEKLKTFGKTTVLKDKAKTTNTQDADFEIIE